MDRQQLKEWELHLNREQDQWNSAKPELERQIKRLEVVQTTLKDKTAAQQRAFESLATDTETLGVTYTELLAAKGALDAEIGLLEGKKGVVTATLADLNALVDSKKASIDAGLAEYETERRKELEDRLTGTRAEVVEAEGILSELVSRTTAKRAELDTVLQALVTQRDSLEREQSQHEGWLLSQADQEAEIQARVDALESQLGKLLYERDEVVSTVTKARQEHDQFTRYEKVAWAALNTKDKELQDRQAELDVGERQLNARRSFLPKL